MARQVFADYPEETDNSLVKDIEAMKSYLSLGLSLSHKDTARYPTPSRAAGEHCGNAAGQEHVTIVPNPLPGTLSRGKSRIFAIVTKTFGNDRFQQSTHLQAVESGQWLIGQQSGSASH